MGVETVTVETWLVGLLAADTTLQSLLPALASRIWVEIASDPAMPYILLTASYPRDAMIGHSRVFVRPQYTVRVVDQTRSFNGTLQAIANRIDALLHPADQRVWNASPYGSVREQPFRLVELGSGGEQIRHLGGTYRVYGPSEQG